MSKPQNTNPIEPAKDAGTAESGANTPDTPLSAGAATPVKKDDFIQAPAAKPDTSQEDTRIKEAGVRKDGIVKDVFNKYVETDESGNTSFEKVPNDMKWAVDEIKSRYFKQEATPTPTGQHDINALLDKRIAARSFESEVERIVQDDSLSDIQKADIKDEFNNLQKKGVPEPEALRIAETLVKATTKKVVGTMPNPGQAPNLTKVSYSNEEMSNMKQSDFNQVMDKVDKGEVRLTN